MAKIIIDNKATIDFDKKYLEDLISLANLPEGNIILLLNDSDLPENQKAVCFSSQLIKFAPDYRNLSSCFDEAKWDCCIAIAKKWCIDQKKHPAYFTFLVGHELGHAYICLSDMTLYIHCSLIYEGINCASKKVVKYPYELPDEKRCDQFGIFLSHQMHGNKQLHLDIDKLKEIEDDIEEIRFDLIKGLSPKNNMNNLRNEIIDFSMPYKDELIRYWKEDFERYGSDSLASYIDDYDALFIKD